MSEQQWKLVPVEPTEEMRAEICSGISHEHMVRNYKLMLSAAPQPPALGGEPEVLGYSVKGNRYAIRLTKGELLELHEGYTGDALIELVDRAHVARLQSDLVSANADKAAFAQNAIDLRQQLGASRAEVERLKTITCTSMGVGDGNGQLIVHGDYDSIKAAQRIFWDRDDLKARTAALEGLLRKAAYGLRQWKEQVAPTYNGEDALLSEIDAALAEGAKS